MFHFIYFNFSMHRVNDHFILSNNKEIRYAKKESSAAQDIMHASAQ